MIKCEDCGKEFKTTQALGGHMRFVHGVRKDNQAPLFPPKRFITDDQLTEELSTVTRVLEQLLDFRNEQMKLNKVVSEAIKESAEVIVMMRERIK